MTEQGLVADEVSYQIGNRMVLEKINLAARPGEVVGVSGASGSGKTSLLLILAGILAPAKGSIRMQGRAITSEQATMVFQQFALISFLTAAENAALPLQGRGMTPTSMDARIRTALMRLGLAELGDRPSDQLSGGQRQRVAVARALVGETPLLIADEPTSELDAENRARVMGLLVGHALDGRIVVLSSDDDEVLEACTQRLRLMDGRLGGGPVSGHQ